MSKYLVFIIIIINCLACSSGKLISNKDLAVTILPRSDWNALDPKLYKEHIPVRITVHHEGTRFDKSGDPAQKIHNIQVWGMGPDRNWADIPYHFLIAPDGRIYEGRNVFTVGETNTEYDPTGHLLITCLGNYEEQEVSQETLNSLKKMIRYASTRYQIPVDSLRTHKDYSKQTNCPGKNLYKYFTEGYFKF